MKVLERQGLTLVRVIVEGDVVVVERGHTGRRHADDGERPIGHFRCLRNVRRNSAEQERYDSEECREGVRSHLFQGSCLSVKDRSDGFLIAR